MQNLIFNSLIWVLCPSACDSPGQATIDTLISKPTIPHFFIKKVLKPQYLIRRIAFLIFIDETLTCIIEYVLGDHTRSQCCNATYNKSHTLHI